MNAGSKIKNVNKSPNKNKLKEECQIWVLKVQANDASSPEICTIQKTVYDELKRNCLSPQWTSVDECMKVAERRNEIFVLPHFSGQVFDHLSGLLCRIYGSLAVLSCLNARERLPKWTHPIESVTLRNVIVCFTGFDYSVRETQTSLIMKMGGIVSRDFNSDVTHLVAAEHNSNSKKYNAAVKRSIPIMSIEWLEKAWEATRNFSQLRFTDNDVIEMYRLKLFSGCLMTCSGVSLEERLLLGQLIEENGGKFKGDMERYKCTHLLTDKNSGEKYRKAKEWGWDTIKIVRLAWLAKCIEKGYRIPENLYEPKVPIKCSTPKSSFSASPACLEFSAISRPKSRNCEGWDYNGTTVNSVLSGAPMELVVEATNTADKSNSFENRTLRKSFSARLTDDSQNVDPFPDLDVSRLGSDDDLLEGLRIYFYGMDKAVLAKWKRLASSLGASVSSVLNETITHIVLGALTNESKVAHEFAEAPSSCAIVKCEWLVGCAKANRLIATSDFLISSDVTNEKPTDNQTLKNAAETFNDRMSACDLKTGAFAVSQRTANRFSCDSVKASSINRIQQLKNDSVKKLSASVGSQLIDSPSVFLDPKKNFISRFDLQKAYERIDELHSFEQSVCSVQSDLSESTVEKVLNEAIVKTAAKTGSIGKISAHCGGEEHENVNEQLECTKFSPQLVKDAGKPVSENNQPAVSNEDKRKMIERCLANLANYEDGKHSEPQNDVKNKIKKRIPSRSKSTANEPSIKRKLESSNTNTFMCDSHESVSGTGNIGWLESNSSSANRTKSEPLDRVCNLFEEAVHGKEKKVPLNFNIDEEVIFIEKQNSTITSFLSNKNAGAQKDMVLDGFNTSLKGNQISIPSKKRADNFTQFSMDRKLSSKRMDNQLRVADEETVLITERSDGPSSSVASDMVFLLSSLEESKRAKYANTITRLGGKLSLEFNNEVNFLVCGDIIRNEKLLASIACGLFVLRPEFLDDSESVGHWLEPELYEWGSTQCVKEHKFTNKKAKELALACRRWRLKISEMNPKNKAFHDWKVLLYCSRRRSVDIGRIISFGGGFCVLRDDVDVLDGFSHALVEKSRYWHDKEITELVRKRIKCFNIDYIANYLSVENIIENDYLHRDYLQCLRSTEK